MPGSIKVSGSFRTVAAPYFKVSGTWKAASVAYTKVNGVWRQWYAANVTDDFNRTNSSTLGTVSNGVTSWTPTKGTWTILSNQAKVTSAISSYPIATVPSPTQSADYELKVDLPAGTGTGVALWVTDANNAYTVTGNTVAATNYTCPSGGTLDGTTCNVSATCTSGCSSTFYGAQTYVPFTYSSTPTTVYTQISSVCTYCTGGTRTCIGSQCYTTSIQQSCYGMSGGGPDTCTGQSLQCTSGAYYSSQPCV